MGGKRQRCCRERERDGGRGRLFNGALCFGRNQIFSSLSPSSLAAQFYGKSRCVRETEKGRTVRKKVFVCSTNSRGECGTEKNLFPGWVGRLTTPSVVVVVVMSYFPFPTSAAMVVAFCVGRVSRGTVRCDVPTYCTIQRRWGGMVDGFGYWSSSGRARPRTKVEREQLINDLPSPSLHLTRPPTAKGGEKHY